jgi:hypothetical protein
MNAEKIGQAAGTIWKKLREQGSDGLSFTDIKKLPSFTAEEALAGIGWLAREGKLCFKTEGKKLLVTLVEEEICVTT